MSDRLNAELEQELERLGRECKLTWADFFDAGLPEPIAEVLAFGRECVRLGQRGGSECGTAESAASSTNVDGLPTATIASPSGELLSEWSLLSKDSQEKVHKWFDLATEHLQAILDAPVVSPVPALSAEQSREQFELKILEKSGWTGMSLTREQVVPRIYVNPLVQAAWEGWQAAEAFAAKAQARIELLEEELSRRDPSREAAVKLLVERAEQAEAHSKGLEAVLLNLLAAVRNQRGISPAIDDAYAALRAEEGGGNGPIEHR